MNHLPEDPARKAHRIGTTRHLDLNSLLREYVTDSKESNENDNGQLANFPDADTNEEE